MKVGVVGTGRIGAWHARTLCGLLPADSLLIYDTDEYVALRVATELSVQACSSVEELVATADAIVVATPTSARMSVVPMAIDKGIPQFCEKPLGATVEEARRLADLAFDRSVPIQVGFQRRFDPEYRMLRQLVASGAIGRVLLIRGTAFDHAPPPAGFEQDGGSIFTDLLIHDADAVRWLTGEEVLAVRADCREVPGEPGEAAVSVATVLLELSGGGCAVLTGSRLDPRGYDHRMEVLGTRDSVTVGLTARTPLRILQASRSCGTRSEIGHLADGEGFSGFIDRFATAYREEMHAFLEMVATGSPSLCGPHDAVLAQQIVTAAEKSARTASRVPLPSVEHAVTQA